MPHTSVKGAKKPMPWFRVHHLLHSPIAILAHTSLDSHSQQRRAWHLSASQDRAEDAISVTMADGLSTDASIVPDSQSTKRLSGKRETVIQWVHHTIAAGKTHRCCISVSVNVGPDFSISCQGARVLEPLAAQRKWSVCQRARLLDKLDRG